MAADKRDPKRSYPCNVDLLVYLRECRGWTQRILAETAGYSERLISKAESGRAISKAAIEILAETLSTEDDQVYFEDLVCDTVALAKEYVSAIYQDQHNAFARIRHFLADDAVFKVSGDPAQIPFAGLHEGAAAIERMLGVFFSLLEAPKDHDFLKCYSFLAQGKQVIVWGETWIHPIGQPLQRPMQISNRMTFHRGKLVMFEDIFDTLEGAELLRRNRPDAS